jgi:hypothetical protein
MRWVRLNVKPLSWFRKSSSFVLRRKNDDLPLEIGEPHHEGLILMGERGDE